MGEPKKVHSLTDRELINQIQEFNDEQALEKLKNRYLPLIKSLAAKYYIRDMEFDDWEQEASIVLITIINSYDPTRYNFGAYYRKCLRNHFYDLIRKQSAKKRIPNDRLTSYSANQAYYDDILKDIKAPHPERMVITGEMIHKFWKQCSDFERMVLKSYINCQSCSKIAKQNNCTPSKIRNAFTRCHHKFQRLRDNGLN